MYILKTCNIVLSITTKLFTITQFLEFARKILPAIKISNSIEKDDILVYVEVVRGKNCLKYDGTTLYVSGQYDRLQLMRDSIMALSRIIESILNENNCFSIHSAAIVKNNEVILFAGEGGVGKTSSALYTTILNPEYKIISGDRTIISNRTILGGTEVLYLRKGSLQKIPQLSQIANDSENLWGELYRMDIEAVETENLTLSTVFFPYQVESAKLHVLEYKEDAKFLVFYDSLAYFSKYYPSICLGQKVPLPDISISTHDFKRIKLAKFLSRKIPTYRILGTMQSISEFVAKNY
jgi:hypothetical protein